MKIEVAANARPGLSRSRRARVTLVRPGPDPLGPEGARIDPRRPRGRARRDRRGCGFLAPGAGDAQERPRLPPHPRRRRDGAAGRYRGGLGRDDPGRAAQPVPHRRPFAPAGLWRDPRRSEGHGPHPRLPGLHRHRSAEAGSAAAAETGAERRRRASARSISR